MSDIVSPLLQWLNANPEYAGMATFLISAAESVAIIGTIVPGSITMTAIGTLAGAGIIPLWATLLWATLGAIVGDGISYWIGHYFKDRLRSAWPFKNNPGLLKSGETFVHKYGVMSVFIGRFVGPVRALVPLVAGMLGMKPLQFTVANITSAIGWAPVYMLPGILLGAASLELPPDIAMHVILVLLLILLFTILCFWFTYKLLQLIHGQITQMQDWTWASMKKTRILSPITVVLKHHDEKCTHGQLNLAIYFLITCFLFFCLAYYVRLNGAANIMVNDAMYHLFRSIRSDSLDNMMINITLLGQKQVILPVVIMAFGWLVYSKRWRASFHALALGVMAAGSVYVLKNIIQSPRPWGILQSPETFSMPSGHTTLATTVYLGLAFIIASSVRPRFRWMVYALGIFIAIAVGMTRLYLGAHWFTDVLSAWLLGMALLMMVILSYEREKEKPIPAGGILLVALATLSITYPVYHYRHFKEIKTNFSQISLPTIAIEKNEWWEKNDSIPAYHASLFGFPSQRINIEWAGDLNQIRATLMSEGWTKPPLRDWVSTLHRIADISSTEYLPLVSPQYLDKKPALTLTRKMKGMKSMLVLRLWDSDRIIKDTQTNIWVGVIGIVPRPYNWIFKKHPGDIEIDETFVIPNKKGSHEWQWKIINMNLVNGTKKPIQHNILLVRQKKLSNHQKK